MKNVLISVCITDILFGFILTGGITSVTCTDSIGSGQDESKPVTVQEESLDWISKLVGDISSSLYAKSPENSETGLADDSVKSISSAETKSDTDIGASQVKDASESMVVNEISTEADGVIDLKSGANSSETNLTLSSTSEDAKSTRKSGRPTKVTCLERNDTSDKELTVQVLNSTTLPATFQMVPNMTIAPCVLALFYTPWCHFSAAASPHYNALPRIFPDITCVAIDSAAFSSLNARFGTVAIPTLLLLHNGQPVAKFNETQYTLDNFSEFVKKYTGLEPVGPINVTSSDFEGPLRSSPSQEQDYLLWTAWIFLISYCCYAITRSTIWHRMVETLRNNWQEAEAQHEHGD